MLKVAEASNDDPFDLDTVEHVMQSIKRDRASQRLPRGATAAWIGIISTWAIVNTAAVLGLVSYGPVRIITPARKSGPSIVSALSNIRPISLVDELAGARAAMRPQTAKPR